jgi:hypothetical protein
MTSLSHFQATGFEPSLPERIAEPLSLWSSARLPP